LGLSCAMTGMGATMVAATISAAAPKKNRLSMGILPAGAIVPLAMIFLP
jgi:hypothetical protein